MTALCISVIWKIYMFTIDNKIERKYDIDARLNTKIFLHRQKDIITSFLADKN